ncbi:hypothetical protein CPB86DRAFT_634892 [Serendipita vermifera]|nr:hypothetical protein CPB86DRAFT_634892 [Serendipita vermifera]
MDSNRLLISFANVSQSSAFVLAFYSPIRTTIQSRHGVFTHLGVLEDRDQDTHRSFEGSEDRQSLSDIFGDFCDEDNTIENLFTGPLFLLSNRRHYRVDLDERGFDFCTGIWYKLWQVDRQFYL